MDGTLTKWSTAGWEVVKETPIAVDDAFTTPVETQLQDDVLGQVSSTLQTGDRFSGAATFELVGGGPQHAAAFTFNSDGTFSYTPAEDFEGLDRFTYRIDDPGQWFEHNLTTGAYTYSQHNYSNVAEVWIEVGTGVQVSTDVDAEEVESFGYIVPVNSDDDNNNGVEDLVEAHGTAADDELVAVDLAQLLRYDCYEPDFRASLLLEDTDILRLWYDSSRTNEIIPHAPSEGRSGIEWLLSQMPATIWVEAISAGTTWLHLQVSGPTTATGTGTTFPGATGPGDVAMVLLTAIEPDLDIWNGQNATYPISDEKPNELEQGGPKDKTHGAFTVANLNDTDGDGRIDADDDEVIARSTTLAQAAAVGATTVVIADPIGFQVGDFVIVGTEPRIRKIQAINGTTVTLNEALTAAQMQAFSSAIQELTKST